MVLIKAGLLLSLFLSNACATIIDGELLEDMDKILSNSLDRQRDFGVLTFHNLDSECTRKAIGELLPKCATDGIESIDPLVRKEVALKLSKCEFENSKVLYPEECWHLSDSKDYTDCLVELKKSPQYWTTFSGNYREVNKICHEQSLPHQKEQIIKLYSNITMIITKLQDDLRYSHSFSKKTQDSLKRQFEEMFTMFQDVIQELRKQKDDFQHDYEVFNQHFSESLTNESLALGGLSLNIDKSVSNAENKLSSLVDDLQEFADLYTRISPVETLHHVKLTILDDYTSFADNIKEMVVEMKENLGEATLISMNQNTRNNEIAAIGEELTLAMNQILSSEIDSIKSQGVVIRSEYEQSIKYFSDFLDQQISEAVFRSSQELESLIATSMNKLDTKINQTSNILEDMHGTVENFSFKLNNLTLVIYDGLKFLSGNKLFKSVLKIHGKVRDAFYYSLHIWNSISNGLIYMLVFCITFMFLPGALHSFLESNNIRQKQRSTFNLSVLFRMVTSLAVIASVVLGTLLATLVYQIMGAMEPYVEKISQNT